MDYNDETKTLTIKYEFPSNISNEIEKIVFHKYSLFNKKLDNLPQRITHLTFGKYFNQKIDKLPKNLKYLKIGWYFQNEIILPKNLKYLEIGWCFKNEIILPKTLKELSLTCNNNLINNIPEHIEKIYIWFSNDDKYDKKVENLPLTIKEIVIENEKFKDYIKIPFGCVLTIKKFEYLIN
jgi:hypothetical protein